MNNTVQIDNTAVNNLFKALEPDKRKQILFKALKDGAKKLQDQTKTQLRASLGSGATTPNRWNGKTMESGIRLTGDKDYLELNVNIMGDFRLKFFERGTKQRFTRKTKANRGNIRPLNFFRQVRDNSNITDIINESITKSLKRI